MRRFTGISATLFACVSACGDDSGTRVRDAAVAADAAAHDAEIVAADAAPDARPAGTVTVKTLARDGLPADNTPVAGVPIIVVQPDGTLGSGAMTGSDGIATLTGVIEGAAITAAYPEDTENDTYLVTTLGVKPGDSLTYGDGYNPVPTAGSAGSMLVTVPPFAGATNYIAQSICNVGRANSGSGSGATIAVLESTTCQPATTPIGLEARDSSDNLLASGYLANAPFTNGATATLATWTADGATSFTMTGTGLGSEVTDDSLQAVGIGIAGQIFYTDGNSDDPAIVGTTATTQLAIPLTYPRIAASSTLSRGGGFGPIDSYRAMTTGTSVAIAQTSMPWLGQMVVSTAIGEAEWLQTSGSAYGGALVTISWNREDAMAETNHSYQWHIIVPPGQTSIDFGTPPAALASVLPGATDDVNSDLQLLDLGSASTYDAFRGIPEWEMQSPETAVEVGDLPSADVARLDGDGGEGVVTGRKVRAPQHTKLSNVRANTTRH